MPGRSAYGRINPVPRSATRAIGLVGMSAALLLSGTNGLPSARASEKDTTAAAPSSAHQAVVQKRRKKLLIFYATKRACTVFPNFPKKGVKGNKSWPIPTGRKVVWRYNVNKTWALISDDARARKKAFPWWGFTKRSCLGKSVKQKGYPAGRPIPKRILQGRSAVADSGWRSVRFNVPAARITARNVKVDRNVTLRDPANFVIGNVPEPWRVHVTGKTRSRGHWVEVYVPNARRWGYIERAALR